jgi:CCR4-NOT transcriptional regulation complex NOT5 subunit
MSTISINGIKYPCEYVDCKDKLFIIKAPASALKNDYKELRSMGKYLKENQLAKEILFVAKDIDFETMNIDEAINYINSFIDELHCIKEQLLESEEDENG